VDGIGYLKVPNKPNCEWRTFPSLPGTSSLHPAAKCQNRQQTSAYITMLNWMPSPEETSLKKSQRQGTICRSWGWNWSKLRTYPQMSTRKIRVVWGRNSVSKYNRLTSWSNKSWNKGHWKLKPTDSSLCLKQTRTAFVLNLTRMCFGMTGRFLSCGYFATSCHVGKLFEAVPNCSKSPRLRWMATQNRGTS
jgi:hypothetical protein